MKEVTLTNIADFSSLSDTEQALVRETIVSGKLDDTMRELIKLTSGSALYEKKWHIPDGALLPQSYVATERDMRYELLKNLQPHYEQA